MLLGWLVVIAAFGGYRDDVFGAGTDEYKRVFNASLVTAGLLGVGCYLAKFQLSRGFFLLAFGVGIPALLVGRWLLRQAVHRARTPGQAAVPRADRRLAGARRRDRGRAAPRVLARLPRRPAPWCPPHDLREETAVRHPGHRRLRAGAPR